MKKRFFLMAGLLAVSSVAATEVARAQETLLVRIPFDFVAGNTTLPAGEYRVQKMDRHPGTLLIQCSDPSAAAFVGTDEAQAKELQSESKLVFNRYDKHYFLSQVWTAGSTSGRQISRSPREKEMAQVTRLESKSEITLLVRQSPARL